MKKSILNILLILSIGILPLKALAEEAYDISIEKALREMFFIVNDDISEVMDTDINEVKVSSEKQSMPQKVEQISTVQEKIKEKNFFERKKIEHKANKMNATERQKALAEELSPTTLDEEIIESTQTIKGSVEENVIISLDDCVKLALINNPNIRYAISNADIYKSKVAQAWAGYFPTFGIGTNYSKNRFLSSFMKLPDPTYNLWNAVNAQANLKIFDFGKTQAGVNVAKKTHEASVNDLQGAINTTVYGVKSAYYNYLFALRQEQILKSSVEKYEMHFNQAKAGYDVGIRARIDVITAEYNWSNAKLDYIKAKHNVDIAKAELNNTMGLPYYTNYSITDTLVMPQYIMNFDDLIKSAYDVRPELLAVENKSEASKILIKASKRSFLPDLSAFGNYTLGGKSYASDYGYQLGLKLEYPVTNFLQLKHEVNEAKSTHERDVAELEKKKLEVFLDVKNAYIQFLNSQESVPVANKAMQEAKKQYEIAAGRYKAGLGDAIELKDAENTYRNAQLNYYSSLMNYNTSVANIEKAVGIPIKENTPIQENNINPLSEINL